MAQADDDKAKNLSVETDAKARRKRADYYPPYC